MGALKRLVEFLIGSGGEDDERSYSLENVLGYPPVMYAHNKICGDFARMPIDVKRIDGNGAVNDLKHDGYRLLREQPNMLQSPSTFKEQILSHAIMYGNGRAAIMRRGPGISELIPLMPDRTWTLVVEGEKWHITKPKMMDEQQFFDGENTLFFHDSEVLHLPGFSFNGIEGLGLLTLGKSAYNLGLDAQRHVANQMKKGFAGKMFLEVPAGIFPKKEQAQEFLDAFNASEGGSDNAGKAALLREGIKASTVGQNNTDAQMVELRRFSRQDVALLFGIDSMPFDGESVSFNSLEQKNLSYLVSLDRWLNKFEEECDRKLRSKKERETHYFKFNAAALLRTDLASTMTALCNGITHRILSPNEARAKLDMNPYEGGDTYENPAISPGQPGQTSDSLGGPPQNRLAMQEMLKSLLQREANNAISGAKNADFVGWIDENYAKWELKLADKLESIGLDRDLARVHCDESRETLLDVAGKSTAETLENNVKDAVSGWKNRYSKLMECQYA